MRVRKEHGQVSLEALMPLVVIIMLMVLCVAVFSAFANAIIAQHALTQTALRVSASGSFSEKQRTDCRKLLPNSATSDCRVYFNGNPPATCQAADYCLRTLLPSPTGPGCSAVSGLRDCFNTASSSADIKPYGALLRVEITYDQAWPLRCLPGTGTCPFGNGHTQVTRYVVITSQTRRSHFS